ncbi:MAG: hypothetical protein ACYS1A_11485 [Planctomycetota bacterium]|jgi:hypothetical protein
MQLYLAQIVLAARDEGGWMQILVFVMIAVFYGISYFLKAKSNKLEKEQQQEKPQDGGRPVQKPCRRTERPVRKTAQPQQRRPIRPAYREIARPQPILEKISIKKDRTQLQRPAEVIEMKIQPELVGKPFEPLPDMDLGLAVKKTTVPDGVLKEPLFDVDDPEALRRAILHYEILGKPVSLRGSSEQIAG